MGGKRETFHVCLTRILFQRIVQFYSKVRADLNSALKFQAAGFMLAYKTSRTLRKDEISDFELFNCRKVCPIQLLASHRWCKRAARVCQVPVCPMFCSVYTTQKTCKCRKTFFPHDAPQSAGLQMFRHLENMLT